MVSEDMELVYGGSERGTMKIAADTIRKHGGKITSVVSPEFKDVWRKDVDTQIISKDIPERKKKMLDISDAIIVLPGGSGTMDEFTEIVETKKWGAHEKPIVLLNINNFWDGLISQYERMREEGFIGKQIDDLIIIEQTPKEAISYLINY